MTTVLLNPIGLDRDFWRFGNVASLPGSVAHEFPGFGSRPRASARPSIEGLADEVVAMHEGELDLVGVSMGAMVAQHVCIRHPDRVRSAVIACTGAHASRVTMTGRAAAVEAGGMEAILDDTLRRWFTPDVLARGDDHPGVAYAKRALLKLDPAAFADGWMALAGHDARAGLPAVGAPLTVVAGRDDVAAPLERCREIAELAPRTRLVVVDGPHMLPLERGDRFAAVVVEHLKMLASPHPRRSFGDTD